jgi:hypothetical protein
VELIQNNMGGGFRLDFLSGLLLTVEAITGIAIAGDYRIVKRKQRSLE